MLRLRDFLSLTDDNRLGVVPAVEDGEGPSIDIERPVIAWLADEVAISVISLELECRDFIAEFPRLAFLEPGNLLGHRVLIDGSD